MHGRAAKSIKFVFFNVLKRQNCTCDPLTATVQLYFGKKNKLLTEINNHKVKVLFFSCVFDGFQTRTPATVKKSLPLLSMFSPVQKEISRLKAAKRLYGQTVECC